MVGAKTRLTRVVKLIPKVAAKDSKNKGLSVGGVTDPLQPARKTRFIRLWPLVWPRNADSRGAKSHVPRAVDRPDTGAKTRFTRFANLIHNEAANVRKTRFIRFGGV